VEEAIDVSRIRPDRILQRAYRNGILRALGRQSRPPKLKEDGLPTDAHATVGESSLCKSLASEQESDGKLPPTPLDFCSDNEIEQFETSLIGSKPNCS